MDSKTERERAVADAILAERTAAMLDRRYPGTRPDSLDFVISELSSLARFLRRTAENPFSAFSEAGTGG